VAIFDGEEQRVVVRVVYDGPAFAGKTTNVRRLYGFFTARRRSELYVPAEREGRTLYFDWLQLDGGLVGGYPLRAQLVTVPGQDELSHRRAMLLEGADVVVFVCDARPAGLREALPMLDSLRERLHRRAAPALLVVQANKQDLEGALDITSVAEELGLSGGQPVVGARAEDGAGVRETAVVAIRLAAAAVQRALIEGGAAGLLGRAQSGEALYEAMVRAEPTAAPTREPAGPPPVFDPADGAPEVDLSAMLETRDEPAPSSAHTYFASAHSVNASNSPAAPELATPLTTDAPRAASEAPRPISDAPRAPSEAPRPISDAPRAPSEAPRRVSDAPRAVSEAPRSASAAPRPLSAAPRVASEVPPPASEAPRPTFDAPASISETPWPASENPRSSSAGPQAAALTPVVPPPDVEREFFPRVTVSSPGLEAALSASPSRDYASEVVPSVTPTLPAAVAPPAAVSITMPAPAGLPSSMLAPPPGAPSTLPPPASGEPPLPRSDEPPGFIWPAATGREVLRRLEGAGEPFRHEDLAGSRGTEDGSASSSALIYEVGLWCAKTSPRRRYVDLEDARAALLRLARRKTLLGRFMPRRTVLSLRDDGQGGYWLWTISPWLATARALMNHARDHDDEERLGEALALYARAAVEAVIMALRQGVVLDVHPSNFGIIGRDAYYLDDDVSEGETLPELAHALLQRVEEYGGRPAAMERYLDAFEAAVRERLAPAEVRRIGLLAGLDVFRTRSEIAARARERARDFLQTFVGDTIDVDVSDVVNLADVASVPRP
jgi:signal recognition particle receptor subunit beta